MKANAEINADISQSSVGSKGLLINPDIRQSYSSVGSKGQPLASSSLYQRLLKAFMAKHDSKRISEVDELLKKSKGKETKLMLVLAKKVCLPIVVHR